MPEVPKWFPRDVEELYRPDPGDKPSIRDPRVATSHGGGACPEQHWGVLTDGRVFYFRYRHGWASINLGPEWYEPGLLPVRNPLVTYDEWHAAYEAGLRDADLPMLYLVVGSGFVVTEENDGSFSSQEELDNAFRQCLDEAWSLPFDDEGWEALRQSNWRKDQNPWGNNDVDPIRDL